MTVSDARRGETGRALLEGLNSLRRQHRYVEDCWYSCPKAADGCCNDLAGDECDCGADEHNARIDALCALVDRELLGGQP